MRRPERRGGRQRRVGSGRRLAATLLRGGLVLSAGFGAVLAITGAAVPARAAQHPATVIPPPPLLLPGVVDPESGPFADRSLADLVVEADRRFRESAVAGAPAATPVEPERRDAALRRYIEGRAALAEGRILVAVRALEEAMALDGSSGAIAAALARAYARAGNPSKASTLFERVLVDEPDQAEALATLGMRAVEASDAWRATQRLGRLFLLGEAQRREGLLPFRSGAEAAAELGLARSLRSLGADRALIEVLERTAARGDSAPDSRLEAEARRSLGDAYARRGDLAAAVEAWTRVPPGTWERQLIEPRVTWGLVALGRDREAVDRFRARITAALRAAEASPIEDEDIALAAWLVSTSSAREALERWGRSLAEGAHGQEARLAATLVPADAVTILRNAAATPPIDRRLVADLLAALAVDSPRAALLEAEGMLAGRRAAEGDLIASLLRSGPDAPALLNASAELSKRSSSVALRARLHVALGDPGEAWRLTSALFAEGTDDAVLRGAALDAAGRLGEPALVAEVADRCDQGDAIELIRLAEAWRRCDEPGRAESVVRRAIDRSDGPTRAAALTLAAQIVGDRAARTADRAVALQALALAREAVAVDPSATGEEGRRLLIGLLDALGAGGDERERERFRVEARQARDEARIALPDSLLAHQLAAERLLGEGAAVDALNALAARTIADPGDLAALRNFVGLLDRLGRADVALARLDQRIAAMPAEPVGWQLWTEATIASGRAEDALARLEEQAARPGGNALVEPLRELALRAAGRGGQADELHGRRIERLPASPRRDLERAAQILAAGGPADDAAAALTEAAEAVEALGVRDGLAGAELAMRLPGPTPARNRLIERFAAAALEAALRDPDAPPAATARAAALAIVSLPAEDASEPRRGALVERAVASARQGIGAGDVPVWLANAQTFADLERAAEGADLLAALLRSDLRIDPASAARLAGAAFALDAFAGGRSEHSIALLDLLEARGVRPFARTEQGRSSAADPLLSLSSLFAMVGDRDGSESILEEAVRRDAGHAMVRNNLGWGRLERGLLDQRTIELIEGAATAEPDDAAILDSLGWLRYRQGRHADGSWGPGSVTLLRKAVGLGGAEPSVESLDHLGDALWRAGERQEAIRAWQEVGRVVASGFPRERTIQALQAYERREYGLRLIDGESWWQRHYGAVAERASAKLARVAGGEEPEVAPMAVPAP